MRLDVVLAGDHVRLPQSVPVPADAGGERIIPATAVRDADPDASPPEIRTASGETVFVSATQRADLELFCTANRIPRQSRPDVWGDLLEPFLDTEFTPERQVATRTRLRQVGLGDEEVADIRAEVAPLIRAYNAVHQDQHHLGLADLLDAATAAWIPEHQQIDAADGGAFRRWAMEIADLGFPRNRP
ncbi:hypothetical protein [Kitasatospora sp. DSM 101779]|uniref:hypothetical protein n=1 Tax=Kitasatospora sp. DSM 101779 TaxID=2853165 RepID=UPI0021D8E73D|nr:hypothetical protein [Kitasatospora sp. DSM 101779]MCU7826720.1 hypothetical protein [Kitasatospora sp. DSM 101779]